MSRSKPAPCSACLESPIPGVPYIAIVVERGGASQIDFARTACAVTESADPAALQLVTLLLGYFADGQSPIPRLVPGQGTVFQQRVWQALQQIPPGEVRTYGELASQLGSSPRAVAGACRANPLAILIPCHRAVSAGGIGGYMGKTEGPEVAIKSWLLHHEGYDIPDA